jgi:hypothetical protein
MKNTMPLEVDEVIYKELSLQLTNGAKNFDDYEVPNEQVSLSNDRFLRMVQKVISPTK